MRPPDPRCPTCPACRVAARADAMVAVATWIRDALGDDAANVWAWECTPFPCGLPSDEQLDDGLRVATGELSLQTLVDRTYEEMSRLADVDVECEQ